MYEGKGGRPAGRAADPTRNGGGNHSGGYQDGAPSVKIKIENVHYEINKEQLQVILLSNSPCCEEREANASDVWIGWVVANLFSGRDDCRRAFHCRKNLTP
jgi:hypothetical protein